jgi:hypothetical protein
VAHERQADGNISPGRDRRKVDLRKELRGEQVLEAIMAANAIAMTIALFLGGVVTGVIVVVALAVRREDRRYSLVGEAPDRLSKSARMLNGVGRRDVDTDFAPLRHLVH